MALDEADLDQISGLIKTALTGDEFTKGIGTAVTSVVQGLKLEDKITAAVTEAAKGLTPVADDKDKDKGGKDKDDKRVAALEAKLEAQQQELRDSKQAERTSRLHSETRAALVKAGIPEARVHLAMPAVVQSGALVMNDDGTMGWKGKDKYGVDSTLSLEAGATAWASTDDGKAFVPPVGSNGTGDGAGGTGGRGGPISVPKREDGTYDLSGLRSKVGSALANAEIGDV